MVANTTDDLKEVIKLQRAALELRSKGHQVFRVCSDTIIQLNYNPINNPVKFPYAKETRWLFMTAHIAAGIGAASGVRALIVVPDDDKEDKAFTQLFPLLKSTTLVKKTRAETPCKVENSGKRFFIAVMNDEQRVLNAVAMFGNVGWIILSEQTLMEPQDATAPSFRAPG
ncbi:hypothetical protein NMY22_g18046 [Coprinellus aureogranulatus]|nr:hypothetical protein NMY22_g18046 [Coprinellus aureogranulatus]